MLFMMIILQDMQILSDDSMWCFYNSSPPNDSYAALQGADSVLELCSVFVGE